MGRRWTRSSIRLSKRILTMQISMEKFSTHEYYDNITSSKCTSYIERL